MPALLVVPALLLAALSFQLPDTQGVRHTAGKPAPAPTFARDVAPILYRHCAVCHHPGEVAPFPLLTYQDAAKRAKLIATVTASRYMPPWQPEPGYGHFQGERRLRDADIATLRRWADAGAPQGD
ncbi:MAG: ascorbate-dependent monooxygenase, partial [Bryobacteraceae bacterium]